MASAWIQATSPRKGRAARSVPKLAKTCWQRVGGLGGFGRGGGVVCAHVRVQVDVRVCVCLLKGGVRESSRRDQKAQGKCISLCGRMWAYNAGGRRAGMAGHATSAARRGRAAGICCRSLKGQPAGTAPLNSLKPQAPLVLRCIWGGGGAPHCSTHLFIRRAKAHRREQTLLGHPLKCNPKVVALLGKGHGALDAVEDHADPVACRARAGVQSQLALRRRGVRHTKGGKRFEQTTARSVATARASAPALPQQRARAALHGQRPAASTVQGAPRRLDRLAPLANPHHSQAKPPCPPPPCCRTCGVYRPVSAPCAPPAEGVPVVAVVSI